jgi:hypothetical protein
MPTWKKKSVIFARLYDAETQTILALIAIHNPLFLIVVLHGLGKIGSSHAAVAHREHRAPFTVFEKVQKSLASTQLRNELKGKPKRSVLNE